MTDIDESLLKVLLVDDNPLDRGMVRRELRKAFDSIEFQEVTNFPELNEAISDGAFDVVITDFQIRWTDGLEVLRRVKLCKPNCPVLMFTATGNEEIAVQAMKAGLDDYIIKNAKHIVRLGGAVRAALEHCQTRVRADRLENRLASLLAQLQVGVFRRKLDGTIIEANDAVGTILGYPSADGVIGNKLSMYLANEASVPQSNSNDADASAEFESAAIRADGTKIWLDVSERRVLGDDGTAVFDGIMADSTARKDAEDEVRRVQDEMAHIFRINTMAEMAAGISHELSQPLTAITNFASGCAQIIRNKFSHATEILEYVERIKEMAHQSAQVMRGLKEFTQRQPRQPGPISVGNLIQSTLDMLQFELRRTNTSVQLNLPNHDMIASVDPTQIRQVLINLIGNAIDAMREIDVKDRQLTITAEQVDELIAVCVTDHGKGIPEDVLDHLFKPFFSTTEQGTGIGLSISSRIIKAHGGNLNARNNADQGATFCFSLPMDSNDEQNTESITQDPVNRI